MRAQQRYVSIDRRWNQYGTIDPERTYLVASLHRSGSSLVAAALTETGTLGVPFEYFIWPTISILAARFGAVRFTARERLRHLRRRLRGDGPWLSASERARTDMAEYVRALQRVRTTPNGVFGVKVHHPQIGRVQEQFGVDLLELVQPRRIVLLTRRDHLRQAVSLHRAQQSGRWSARGSLEPDPPPPFDPSAIEELKRRIEQEEAGWHEVLSRYDAPVHRMVYEELDADYEGVMAACFAFLGEPNAPVPPRGLDRLADAVTEEWVARLGGTARP
jgi:LPS sulfotransferase NodH